MENLAVFVPAISIALLDPAVQAIDGPEVTAAMWLALRFSITGAEPATYWAAHFSGATPEQKQVLIEAGVVGLWIGATDGTHADFLARAAELGQQQIVEPE